MMNRRTCLVVLSLMASVAGCYTSHTASPDPDGGFDTGLRDTGLRDTGLRDTGLRDTGPRDTGLRDTGLRDTGLRDAGPRDTGLRDTGPRPGLACSTDADCDGACVLDRASAPADLARAPLVCGPATAAADDGHLCERSADCGRGLCVLAGSCVAPCVADSDCSSRQFCARLWVATSDATEQWFRGCVNRADPPSGTVVRRARVGVARGGVSPDVVELPPAPGTQILVVQPAVPQLLGASRLSTADAPPVVLFDAEAFTGFGPAPRSPFYLPDHQLSILLPSGPRTVLSDAGYTLGVYAESRTPLFATSVSRETPGDRLDLDLYYAGARGLAPTGRRGPPVIASALRTLERIYSAFGLRLGRIRQHAIVGALGRRYAALDGGPDGDIPALPELLQLSAGARRGSVSIFLVSTSDLILGVAGGVPGPQTMNGTPGSGVAIVVDAHDPSVDDLGLTMAHEVGHYLGLFHTTEADGSLFEPLPDTPRCPPTRDANGDGYVDSLECAGRGGQNLMFWQGVGEGLSAQQRDVLAHAPLLR